MTDQFTMSTNAHHPDVKSVSRLSDGTLVINLGGTGYAHVGILTTDEEWRAIVRAVDQQVAKLDENQRCRRIVENPQRFYGTGINVAPVVEK
jgi:hypothetical protein